MKKAKVIKGYSVLELNDEGVVIDDFTWGTPCITVDQLTGDILEVWKEREEDNFLFVYCHRLELGYYVHPKLVDIRESEI